jgi:hypothetical protein
MSRAPLLKEGSVALNTQTRIISIQSFDDIRSELNRGNPDTLVVFDVDDVLITYKDLVLRPCGACFRPVSWSDIDPNEIPYLMSIMLGTAQRMLVEPAIPQLIKELQDRGVKTIALTAARTGKFGVIENAEDWRVNVLKQFNIDFSISIPQKQIIYFDDEGKNESDYSLFKNGIIFLGNEKQTKGDLLVRFLKQVQLKPRKVFFIDDKMSNVIPVEAALRQYGIPFQGYHYKGVEMLPGKLDVQGAEVQFACLRKDHKWLSDLEAKKEEKCLLAPHQ